jgi:4-diphosphocytidyl-2C-methyl-D-erythritol kinase
MELVILVVVVFAFGWYVGSTVTAHLLSLSFRQILRDLGIKDQQLRKLAQDIGADIPDVNASTSDGDQLTPVEITIEQHQGVLYAYRKDTKQFLGQGTDRDTLVNSITTRLQGVRLKISDQDGADLLQKNNG